MFYILFILFFQNQLFAQNGTSYDEAFQEYRNENYSKSEKLFEKAYNEGLNKEYSAYMVGYLNLYFLESVDYYKALKYLNFVKNNIPDDINKNYFYNHIGLCHLYKAINKKNSNESYENELLEAHKYFNQALQIEKNDITLNNIGRVKIEFSNIDSVKESAKFFRYAYSVNSKSQYMHNEATAYERVGHLYYELSIKGNSFDDVNLRQSFNYYTMAYKLYDKNSNFTKSRIRTEIMQKYILSRIEFNKFK